MDYWNTKSIKIISIILIVVFCVILRGYTAWNAEVTSRDAISYIKPAQDINHGFVETFKSTTRHPGYPTAIYLAHRAGTLFGLDNSVESWIGAGQVVSIVFSALTTIGIFFFARLAFNWKIAALGTLIFTAGRKWVYMSSDILSEPMMCAFCVWGSLLLAICVIKLKRKMGGYTYFLFSGWLTGLLWGLGYLVKPEALAMLLAGLVVLFYYGFFCKRVNLVKSISTFAGIMIGFLMAALPYIFLIGRLTNRKHLEDFTANTDSVILASSLYDIWPGIDKIGEQLGQFLNPIVSTLIVIALINTYFVSRRFRPAIIRGMKIRPANPIVFIMLAVFISFSIPILGQYMKHGFISHRYMAASGCLLVGFAGAGCITLAEIWIYIWTLTKKFTGFDLPLRLSKPNAALTIVILIITVSMTVDSVHKPLHKGKAIFKTAGLALQDIAACDESLIITDSPRISLYSQHPAVDLPAHHPTSQQEFLNILKTKNIKFLALTQTFLEGRGHIKVENIKDIIKSKKIKKIKKIQDKKHKIFIMMVPSKVNNTNSTK